MRLRSLSETLFLKSKEVIAHGVNSPARACSELGMKPLVVKKGRGDTIWDVDGYSYIDYCNSWGALIHGHAHPAIISAVHEQLSFGSSFGIPTESEEKLARLILSAFPSIEKIRFVSSGTEATMSAVRLARAYTGRAGLVKFAGHYHGHADSFLVQAGSGLAGLNPTSSSSGIPSDFVKHTLVLPFNDKDACRAFLKEFGKNIAAVILEPVAANMGVVLPKEDFLHFLREETAKQGILLIFDEVISGFRVTFGGVQTLFGIDPDITCLGKIIGGGFPAAAFGGKEKIMSLLAPLGPVYQAGTLSGNPVAMEAGYATLTLCKKPDFYKVLEEKTTFLTKPLSDFFETHEMDACIQKMGSMFTLFFGKKKVENFEDAKTCQTPFFKECFYHLFNQEIYLSPASLEANFVSSVHSFENLTKTKDCILEFLSSCFSYSIRA